MDGGFLYDFSYEMKGLFTKIKYEYIKVKALETYQLTE